MLLLCWRVLHKVRRRRRPRKRGIVAAAKSKAAVTSYVCIAVGGLWLGWPAPPLFLPKPLLVEETLPPEFFEVPAESSQTAFKEIVFPIEKEVQPVPEPASLLLLATMLVLLRRVWK